MILLELFWSFAHIGLFSIGGGYGALPLIQSQVVQEHHWLTMKEFADVLTISQMTPGPISINAATFVGTRIAGLPGAIAATLGSVIPSFLIVLTLAWAYYKYRSLSVIQGVLEGLRPAVVALITSAGVSIVALALWKNGVPSLLPGDVDWVCTLLFAVALVLLRVRKPNPMLVMAVSGLAGLAAFSLL